MSLRVVKARWLVAPLTAFFLLFSGGAAAAPDCHIEAAAPVKNGSVVAHEHSAAPHSHSHQSASSVVSTAQELIVTAGSGLNNEMCVVVGFIVLLLLRFSRVANSIFTIQRIPQPRYLQPFSLSRNLGYLNLTHLKLGIIRI